MFSGQLRSAFTGTLDPFLFCAYHRMPTPGNERLGPEPALLKGRNIGMDFELRDGWRITTATSSRAPRHPHRGFETVTLARHGYIDHADSMGAGALEQGDAQWMTAGKAWCTRRCSPSSMLGAEPHGVVSGLAEPARARQDGGSHFTMIWSEDMPPHVATDAAGRKTTVVTVAGALGDHPTPTPPPSSWASRQEAGVAI